MAQNRNPSQENPQILEYEQRTNSTNIGFNKADEGVDLLLSGMRNIPNKVLDSSGIATPNEIDLVIGTIITEKKLEASQATYNKVLVTLAHMCQRGATSPKYAESITILDYGVSLKVGDLKFACKKNGITVRKFARGIRGTIIKLAKKFNIEGNLAKSYKLTVQDYDVQDLIWVSDFNTFSDDPEIPEHIKEWLLNNFKNRFRPQ